MKWLTKICAMCARCLIKDELTRKLDRYNDTKLKRMYKLTDQDFYKLADQDIYKLVDQDIYKLADQDIYMIQADKSSG